MQPFSKVHTCQLQHKVTWGRNNLGGRLAFFSDDIYQAYGHRPMDQ